MFEASRLAEVVRQCGSGEQTFVVSGPPRAAFAGVESKQAVVFLKPELLTPKADFQAIYGLIVSRLAEHGIRCGAHAVLGAGHLQHIIAEHYGVINRISQLGVGGLSAAGKAELSARSESYAGVEIYGGHQLLGVTDLGPADLLVLVRKAGTEKLAPGTYLSKVDYQGSTYGVLNGFHPAQLAQYTDGGAVVLAIEVVWDQLAWSSFRQDVIGSTDPAKAASHTIRGLLLTGHAGLHIDEIDMNRNGIHGSAGPVEAMVELSRFFYVPMSATAMATVFDAAAYRSAQFAQLISADPPLASGRTLFEATEGEEPTFAAGIVSELARPLRM